MDLPLNASPIRIEWMTTEGGVGVTASTDGRGTPLMGVYMINKFAHPRGLPLLLPRTRLITDLVLTIHGDQIVRLYIDALISSRGLDLIVRPPHHIAARGMDRRRSVLWSGEPRAIENFYQLPHDRTSQCLVQSA